MADGGWALTSLYHTVVNCADLDRSVAFYKLLGFEILNDRRNVIWPPFVASIFGLQRAQGRGVLMILPSDPNGPMLDLLEWLEPRALFPDPKRVDVTVPRIIADASTCTPWVDRRTPARRRPTAGGRAVA